MPEFPTAELVAAAWVKTLDGVDPTKVATKLPADPAVWAATGFVQVSVVGGSSEAHTPLYGPVTRLDCWAANLNSTKPPWGRAGSLAERIRRGTYDHTHLDVDLGDDFYPARVLSVYPVGEPTRVPLDEAGFARVYVDVRAHWTVTA